MKKTCTKGRLLKMLLFGMLLCMLLGTSAQAGWKTTAQGKQYLISQKKGYAKGWKKIKGKYYYFNKEGYLQKGWLTYKGNTYFLNTRTGVRVSGKWFKVDGSYYYAAKNGKIQKSKWVQYRYVGKDGKRQSGWLKLGSATYYLRASNGKRVTGWQTIDGKTYYFASNGKMQRNGWKKINGKYYYLQKDGTPLTNTWIGKYWVGADGARTGKTRSTGLVKQSGKYYYYDENYQKITGWKTVGKKTYHFGTDGAADIGLTTIDGKQYYFASNGVMSTGFVTIEKKMYYFGNDGALLKNTTVKVDGATYKLDANGCWAGGTKGKMIVNFAKKFKGYRYVYGGNNLYTGVDCSGFTQQVMLHFGIRIPRTAEAQSVGSDGWGSYTKSVSIRPTMANLQAGDLVFYYSPVGHVGLYIGSGKIIHASNENTGIIISSYNYTTPVAARRYWS